MRVAGPKEGPWFPFCPQPDPALPSPRVLWGPQPLPSWRPGVSAAGVGSRLEQHPPDVLRDRRTDTSCGIVESGGKAKLRGGCRLEGCSLCPCRGGCGLQGSWALSCGPCPIHSDDSGGGGACLLSPVSPSHTISVQEAAFLLPLFPPKSDLRSQGSLTPSSFKTDLMADTTLGERQA